MDTVFEIDATRPSDDCLRIQLAGQWNSPAAPPTTQGIEEQLDERVRRIEFDTTNLQQWRKLMGDHYCHALSLDVHSLD